MTMGANDSHSPARRPQNERSPSSQSMSRGSPSDGALAKSHKGSSRQLHKAHAVGHGRHPHARVPSHGKNLHKLSKLGHAAVADGAGHTATHTRSASHSPSRSPSSPDFRRNSSHTSLPRTGSKVSIKKNRSEASLARNGSAAKFGNKSKSEKAQTKTNLKKGWTDDAPIKGTANFQLGEDAQDDEWTEDSSSPLTTRQSSAAPSRPKTPLTRDPPSPDHSQDDPPPQSPSNLPHSPPESPPPDDSKSDLYPARKRTQANGNQKPCHYDPPDPQAVTKRLLSRSSLNHTPLSQTSTVVASITTPVRSGSPSDSHGSRTSLPKEQSMPADGISRFLEASGSGKDSVTPGSVSHLQSNLAHLDRDNTLGSKTRQTHTASSSSSLHDHASKPLKSRRDHQPESTPPTTTARRSKSATTLSRTLSSTSTPSPPISPSPSSTDPHPNHQHTATTTKPAPSPFESARGANPAAGKSLTQLKLDLQRLSAQRADTPREPPHNNPLLTNGHGYGGMLNKAGLWNGGGGIESGGVDATGRIGIGIGETDMAARVSRQWETARKEVEGATTRYHPEIVRGSMVARQKVWRGETTDLSAAQRKVGLKLRYPSSSTSYSHSTQSRSSMATAATSSSAASLSVKGSRGGGSGSGSGSIGGGSGGGSHGSESGLSTGTTGGSVQGGSQRRIRFEVGGGGHGRNSSLNEDAGGGGGSEGIDTPGSSNHGDGDEDDILGGLVRRMWVGGGEVSAGE